MNWQDYCKMLKLPATTSAPIAGERNPTQLVSVVRVSPVDGQREVVSLSWGLLPAWATSRKDARKLFNLRSETVGTKFRSSFQRQRCVIPGSAFHEWQGPPPGQKKKIPFIISNSDRRLLSFAGVWAKWEGDEGPIETCSILTRPATKQLAQLHHRMPVILDDVGTDLWLEPGTPEDALQTLLVPSDGPSLVIESLAKREQLPDQGELF